MYTVTDAEGVYGTAKPPSPKEGSCREADTAVRVRIRVRVRVRVKVRVRVVLCYGLYHGN